MMQNKKFTISRSLAFANLLLFAFIFGGLVLSSTSFAQDKPKVKTAKTTPPPSDDAFSPANAAPNSDSTYRTKTHLITLGLGQGLLFERYSDYGDDQITGDVFYTYRASYTWDFMANYHWQKFKKNNTWAKIQGVAMSIRGNLMHYDQFLPYVLGGLGLYRPQIQNKEGRTSVRKTVLGLNLGAGVELQLHRHFAVGLLGQIHNPFKIKASGDHPKLDGRYAKIMMTGSYIF